MYVCVFVMNVYFSQDYEKEGHWQVLVCSYARHSCLLVVSFSRLCGHATARLNIMINGNGDGV